MSTIELTTTTEAEKRAAVTSGLRKLADLLDNNPGVKLPPSVFLHASYSKVEATAQLAAFARAMPKVEKSVDDYDFNLTGQLDGLKVVMSAPRSQVCEKREVTKVVEEWICPDSLLEYAAAVAEVPA